jgi:hypothetical protein
MIEIVKYKANDGNEFDTKEKCIERDNLILKVDNIMRMLPELPINDDCDFANGKGYIKHDRLKTGVAKLRLLELCKEHVDHKWIQQTIDDDNVHPSYVSRILGDYSISPLSNAWHRFTNIDSRFREWGQPCFANNPEQGLDVCLNKEY